MIAFLDAAIGIFLWPFVALSLGVLAASLLVRKLQIKDPRLIHAAFLVALLQGLLINPWSINIPLPSWLPTIFSQANSQLFMGTNLAELSGPNHTAAQVNEAIALSPAPAIEADERFSAPVGTDAVEHKADGDVRFVQHSSRSNDGAALKPVASDEKTVASAPSPLLSTAESRDNAYTSTRRPIATAGDVLLGTTARAYSTVKHVLAGIWLTGVALGLAQLGRDIWTVRRLYRSRKAAPETWIEEVRIQAKRHGLRKLPRVACGQSSGPLLCPHWAGPVLVLPKEQWHRLPARERRVILSHELAHFVRGDLYWLFAARLVTILHWFNPLAYYGAHKLEEAAEWACDAWATRQDSTSAVHLAHALVRFLESGQLQFPLVSAVGGASMKSRLLRLVSMNSSDSSFQRRVTTCCVIGIAMLGLLRFRLTGPLEAVAEVPAQAAPAKGSANAESSDDEGLLDPQLKLERDIHELVEKLSDEDREELKAFKEMAEQEFGQTVIRGRMNNFEWEVRNEARRHGLDRFIEATFKQGEGDEYVVRPEKNEDMKRFVDDATHFNADLQSLLAVFSVAADRLPQSTDAEKLMARVMKSEGFTIKAYNDEVRNLVRPSVGKIEERLGQALARNGRGELVVPKASREEVAKRVRRLREETRELKPFSKEILEWANELVGKTDEERQLIDTMKTPEFAIFAIVQSTYDNDDVTVEQQLENFFNQLEDNTKDGVDGLEFAIQDESEMSKVARQFERAKRNAVYVGPLLGQLADEIRPADELHRHMAELLRSPLAAYRLVKDSELSAGDVEEAAKRVLPRVIIEVDGVIKLSEEAAGNAEQIAEEVLRGQRELRRRGRKLDELATKINDQDVAKAISSTGGKLLLARTIQEASDRLVVDSFPMWRDAMFEQTPSGYVLKEEKLEELNNMLNDMRNLQKELAKNDF